MNKNLFIRVTALLLIPAMLQEPVMSVIPCGLWQGIHHDVPQGLMDPGLQSAGVPTRDFASQALAESAAFSWLPLNLSPRVRMVHMVILTGLFLAPWARSQTSPVADSPPNNTISVFAVNNTYFDTGYERGRPGESTTVIIPNWEYRGNGFTLDVGASIVEGAVHFNYGPWEHLDNPRPRAELTVGNFTFMFQKSLGGVADVTQGHPVNGGIARLWKFRGFTVKPGIYMSRYNGGVVGEQGWKTSVQAEVPIHLDGWDLMGGWLTTPGLTNRWKLDVTRKLAHGLALRMTKGYGESDRLFEERTINPPELGPESVIITKTFHNGLTIGTGAINRTEGKPSLGVIGTISKPLGSWSFRWPKLFQSKPKTTPRDKSNSNETPKKSSSLLRRAIQWGTLGLLASRLSAASLSNTTKMFQQGHHDGFIAAAISTIVLTILFGLVNKTFISKITQLWKSLKPAIRARLLLMVGVISFGAHFPVSNFAWQAGTDRLSGLLIMFTIATGISIVSWYWRTTPAERGDAFKEIRESGSEFRRFAGRTALQGGIIWGFNALLFIMAISLGWISAEEFALIQGCGVVVGILYDLRHKKSVAANRWVGALIIMAVVAFRFHFLSATPLPLVVPALISPLLPILRHLSSSPVIQMKILGYAAVLFSTTLFVLNNIRRNATGQAMTESQSPAVQSLHRHFPFAAGILDYGASALLIAVVKITMVALAGMGWVAASQDPLWHWALVPAAFLIAIPFFFVNWAIPRTESMVFVPLFDTLPFWIMGWVFGINHVTPPPAAGIAAGIGVLGSYTAAIGYPMQRLRTWIGRQSATIWKNPIFHVIGSAALFGLYIAVTDRVWSRVVNPVNPIQGFNGIWASAAVFSLIVAAALLRNKPNDRDALGDLARQQPGAVGAMTAQGTFLQGFNVHLFAWPIFMLWVTSQNFALLGSSNLVFTALFLWLLMRVLPTKKNLFGIGLIITGVSLIVGVGLSGSSHALLGYAMVLASQANLAWLLIRRQRRLGNLQFDLGSGHPYLRYFGVIQGGLDYAGSFVLTLAAGTAAILAGWIHGPLFGWDPLIPVSGVLFALTWIGISNSLKHLRTSTVLPIFATSSAWALFWISLITTHQVPGPTPLLGAALTIAGAYFATRDPFTATAHEPLMHLAQNVILADGGNDAQVAFIDHLLLKQTRPFLKAMQNEKVTGILLALRQTWTEKGRWAPGDESFLAALAREVQVFGKFRLTYPGLDRPFISHYGVFTPSGSSKTMLAMIREHPEEFQGDVVDLGAGGLFLTLGLLRAGVGHVYALDIDNRSLRNAVDNLAEESPENQARVTLGKSHLFSALPELMKGKEPRVDAVINNSPLTRGTQDPENTVTFALNGGRNFEVSRQAVQELPTVLKPGGAGYFLVVEKSDPNFKRPAGFFWTAEDLRQALPDGWVMEPFYHDTDTLAIGDHVELVVYKIHANNTFLSKDTPWQRFYRSGILPSIAFVLMLLVPVAHGQNPAATPHIPDPPKAWERMVHPPQQAPIPVTLDDRLRDAIRKVGNMSLPQGGSVNIPGANALEAAIRNVDELTKDNEGHAALSRLLNNPDPSIIPYWFRQHLQDNLAKPPVQSPKPRSSNHWLNQSA